MFRARSADGVRWALGAISALASLVLALALPTGGQAQSSIVIRAGEVLDGTGRALGPSTIVVQGSSIVEIAASMSRQPTYDLAGLTVMPGGIDTHDHIA